MRGRRGLPVGWGLLVGVVVVGPLAEELLEEYCPEWAVLVEQDLVEAVAVDYYPYFLFLTILIFVCWLLLRAIVI